MAYNILIVDDSRVTREVLARTLHMAGIPLGEIHHAADGAEALRVLDQTWIDIVFSDINMPVMDGLELVDRLQRRDEWERLPVIIVSTEGSKSRIEELQKLGVRGYIRKPFTPEQVAEMIGDVMGDPAHGG